MRADGFYKIKVTEYSGTMSTPFWTVGLWVEDTWKFADGDGDEFGSSFDILEVEEILIATHRDYENI